MSRHIRMEELEYFCADCGHRNVIHIKEIRGRNWDEDICCHRCTAVLENADYFYERIDGYSRKPQEVEM